MGKRWGLWRSGRWIDEETRNGVVERGCVEYLMADGCSYKRIFMAFFKLDEPGVEGFEDFKPRKISLASLRTNGLSDDTMSDGQPRIKIS